MSKLFTANSCAALSACLPLLEDGDALLLIEDGIYAMLNPAVGKLHDGIHLYALADDLVARGMQQRVPERFARANYNDFVQLCCDHDKVVNWF